MTPEMLYKEYRTTVLRYISARIPSWEDAEDLCEEVFAKLLRLLDSYDESKAAVSTLVYKLSHDIVVDWYRTHRRPLALFPEQEALPSAEETVINKEQLDVLKTALAKLPQEQRDILILRFCCGWTLVKIAETTGLTYNMVVSRQKSALKALRKMLE